MGLKEEESIDFWDEFCQWGKKIITFSYIRINPKP